MDQPFPQIPGGFTKKHNSTTEKDEIVERLDDLSDHKQK